MDYTLRLSHSASGVNLYLCKNSFRRFAEVSPRWAFKYDASSRLLRIMPSPKGWKLGEHGEDRDGGRIFGPDDCEDMPMFGVVPYQFEEIFIERGEFGLELPSMLPAMRVVNTRGNSIDGRKCEVILTLMDRDLSFHVPEGELLDVVMNWTRSGYSS